MNLNHLQTAVELSSLSTAALYFVSHPKRIGVHEINALRQRYGEYHHLLPQMRRDPERFHRYLRMYPSTFDYILSKISPYLEKNWTNFIKNPILPEEKLVITLRFLVTGCSFVVLHENFRVGVSTAREIVYTTVKVLWDQLQPDHMRTLGSDDWKRIAEEFHSRWNYPHCLGCIDGKHIRVKCPRRSGSLYYNYKGFFSVVLQGVCSADYKFTYVDVGGLGQQSDGGTFVGSAFGEAFHKNTLNIPSDDVIPGSDVILPYVFLADEGYPLEYHLMRPYSSGTWETNTKEEYFNSRLSRVRKTIECAFGILNTKWRILWRPIECHPTEVENIVLALCVLHNVIIDREGVPEEDLGRAKLFRERYIQQKEGRRNICNRSGEIARQIREEFANYFWYSDHQILGSLIKPATRVRWLK